MPASPSPSPIPTPPETTLSPPLSPTTTTMAPPVARPIYLIVATTTSPPLGIGLRGSLPWKPLRTDMRFFKAITCGPAKTERGANAVEGGGPKGNLGKQAVNAVIMGRKTWDSIPARFRPLGGRKNVLISRTLEQTGQGEGDGNGDGVVVVRGLQEALETVDVWRKLGQEVGTAKAGGMGGEGEAIPGQEFIIGGAEIYRQAVEIGLALGRVLRVLQTQVRRKDGRGWECDTFFPVELDGIRGKGDGWRRVGMGEIREWVGGVDVPGGIEEGEEEGWVEDEGGECEIRVVGWEKG